MPPELPSALLREGLMLLATVGGPLFAALLVSGLAMGIVQASTQISDPAFTAVPRLLVAGVAIWMLGGWMMERLSGFLASALHRMAVRPF
jgi:flagellar biosynthesis protein FliQ